MSAPIKCFVSNLAETGFQINYSNSFFNFSIYLYRDFTVIFYMEDCFIGFLFLGEGGILVSVVFQS